MTTLTKDIYEITTDNETLEYVATSLNNGVVTLMPKDFTWLAVKMNEKEFDKLEVVGQLKKEELNKDFTVNSLF